MSPSSAVPAPHAQLWSLGCSCVYSSGPLHSLSGTCCRPKGCLIPEAFSALLLCACAVLICLALSSHRPLLRCVCLFLEVLTASALCLGLPSIPNPCVRRSADTVHLFLFFGTGSGTGLESPLAGCRPVRPRLLSAYLQLPGPGSTSPCYSLLLPLRAFFNAGFMEQTKSFKHVTKSYPSASAAFFSCS